MSGSALRTGSYTRTEGRPPQGDGIIPRFHMEAVEDPVASAKEGRQCWKQEERIQFLCPGSPNQHVERVTDDHRQRWPDQYAAFRRGEEMSVDGIPLEQWAALKKPQVFELKALGFHTVEQCAEASDAAIQRVNFGQRLRELARAYLDDAYSQAEFQKRTAELDSVKGEMASLKQQNTELAALLNQVHGQLMTLQNKPPEVATFVQGAHDPIALAHQAAGLLVPVEPSQSSLADLPEPPRRRGRPSNAEIAARQGQEAA